MKAFLSLLFSVAVAAAAAPALADDPGKLPEGGTTAHECPAMKTMDMSRMDMNDPVMTAMHDKCMSGMHGQGDAAGHDHSGGHDSHGSDTAAPPHEHDKDGK